jgi:hypothetical protein
MKLYNLTHRAYIQYTVNTKGNRDTSKKTARLKLSRNIALGRVVEENDVFVTYQYGFLFMRVRKLDDTIVDVHNEFRVKPYEPDLDAYIGINDLYGLSNEKEGV